MFVSIARVVPLALAASALAVVAASPPAAATSPTTSSYAGGAGFGDGGPALDARITFGEGGGQVTTDPQGRVVFADPVANEIRRINTDGTIVTIAGGSDHAGTGPGFTGQGAGFSGDG